MWPVIRSGAAANLPTDGMLLALAPVFAVTAARTPVLLPLLVIVVWNVYCAAQLALARQHDATHDALTDLANRRKFFDEVRHAHNRAHRERYSFAIAVLDLDGFKKINDQLGHLVGDGVLEELAARLRRACRSIDVAGRLGGDEFAVLLGHVEDMASARAAIRGDRARAGVPVDRCRRPAQGRGQLRTRGLPRRRGRRRPSAATRGRGDVRNEDRAPADRAAQTAEVGAVAAAHAR